MATQVSPAVAALVAESPRWHTGQSKRTRAHFFIIPSRTDPNVAHWANCTGCTCRGYLNRGRCAHHDAVKIVVERNTRPVAS